MVQKNKIYNILIFVFACGLVFVLVYKFVIRKPAVIEGPRIDNPQDVIVYTLDGNETNLAESIGDKGDCYCLFFEISNCHSCILKGIYELENLEKNGKKCLGIALHDWLDDIKGWSQNYKLKTFLMIKKIVFHENFSVPYLPLLIRFKDGKIYSYQYIRG
ncbi:MAG: hypothetical protein L0Y73_04110 [Candidatus Aminicenantes bacterium]|nr:hypothetical protein [Candidatus Aminicenantes bacterium]